MQKPPEPPPTVSNWLPVWEMILRAAEDLRARRNQVKADLMPERTHK